jgi:prepilin-type N-terminal cleavage/methylation domain-containing protein
MKSQKGFSLIELLCVVAIIGLLAAIALPTYSDYRQKANYAAVVAECRQLYNSFISYHQDNGQYPDAATFDLSNFEPLRTAGYYHGAIGRKLSAKKADAYDAPNAAEFWLQVTQGDNIINQFLVIHSDKAPLAPGVQLRGVHLVRNGALKNNL